VRLLLASSSPRRRELLAAAGWAFDVEAVDVDERQLPDEAPDAYVERVARAKAIAGAARHPGRPVVGADTTVVIDGVALGKPADAEDAARMLARLSGRSHQVLTGVAVARGELVLSTVERTTVWFVPMSRDEIRRYVETGEPMDKAGAYAIQGFASRFITRIEGSYANVVGLPVTTLATLLGQVGVETVTGHSF
jgi:septum formation protein